MTEQIKTERLTLRPFVEADGDRVVNALGNYEISKWLARVPHPFTHEDLRLLDESGQSRWPGLMCVDLDGAAIGAISIDDHFGYWLEVEHWGKGFATEAGRAALNYAFVHSDRAEMPSGYFAGNSGSARVLQKLGFTHVATYPLYNRARDIELENHDLVLTRAGWEAGQ